MSCLVVADNKAVCESYLCTFCRELEKKGLKVFTKEKKSMKFLQKYRHKGVFYMVRPCSTLIPFSRGGVCMRCAPQ
jgi:hypothetical protein